MFLDKYKDIRDLHSFPTRRSSDLSSTRTTQRGPTTYRHLREQWVRLRGRRNSVPVVRVQSSSMEPSGDRKSTRLNSSHVRISYAVFCLKKKTSMDHTNLTKPQKPK